MNDFQHFTIFEYQHAKTIRRSGFANAQVQRVQMHIAHVFDCAVIEITVQQISCLIEVSRATSSQKMFGSGLHCALKN